MRTKLLRSIALIGTIGFGGGSALIPIFERELVYRRKILNESQFIRHTVVANITPGALPVKLAASAGLATGGWLTALIAAFVIALPGVLGTVGLIALSKNLGPSAIQAISYASVGITAFIVVLLIGYIVKVHAKAGLLLRRFILITTISALLTGLKPMVDLIERIAGVDVGLDLFVLSPVVLILGSLLLIVVFSLPQLGRSSPNPQLGSSSESGSTRPAMKACFGFVVLTVLSFVVALLLVPNGFRIGYLIALSSITSFGGGEAYIAVADAFFVQPAHVGTEVFYTQLVPVANALPGPILVKVAAGLGYLVGVEFGAPTAWALAAVGAVVAISACCVIAMPVLGAYSAFSKNGIVVNISRYILPVICGLLISVSATMLGVAADVGVGAGIDPFVLILVLIAAIASMTLLHLRNLVSDLLMLLVAGGVSLAVLWLTSTN